MAMDRQRIALQGRPEPAGVRRPGSMPRTTLIAISVAVLSFRLLAEPALPDGAAEKPAASGQSGAASLASAAFPAESGALATLPVPAEVAEAEAGEVVVAYYCHVTFRCETCLTAERLIADLLRTDFAGLVEAKRLLWLPVDYEQPENAAYAEAFGLDSGPAFILGRWRAGQLVEWHDVLEIWDVSDSPTSLIEVATDRLKLFLQAEKWHAAMDSARAARGMPTASIGATPSSSTGTAPTGAVNTAPGAAGRPAAATNTHETGEGK